jgi:hypothetical protein
MFDGQVEEIFLAKNYANLYFQANQYFEHLHSYMDSFPIKETFINKSKESLFNNIKYKLSSYEMQAPLNLIFIHKKRKNKDLLKINVTTSHAYKLVLEIHYFVQLR